VTPILNPGSIKNPEIGDLEIVISEFNEILVSLAKFYWHPAICSGSLNVLLLFCGLTAVQLTTYICINYG
jgi:hypothetical protein